MDDLEMRERGGGAKTGHSGGINGILLCANYVYG